MNIDIENKLNELLKMKDDLDELKSENIKNQIIENHDNKMKKVKIIFYVWLAVSIALMIAGMYGIEHNSDKYKFLALFIALVGFNSTILMKLWYWIANTKLAVLQELKLLQVQIAKLGVHDVKND
jgi:hypothetical protein